MRLRMLSALIAVAGLLTTAGCSGGQAAASSLPAADKSACDALNRDTTPTADPLALEHDFGLNGAQTGTSSSISPYAMLVGAAAQLENSGYSGDSKLGEYVGQLRGVCETRGWRANS